MEHGENRVPDGHFIETSLNKKPALLVEAGSSHRNETLRSSIPKFIRGHSGFPVEQTAEISTIRKPH